MTTTAPAQGGDRAFEARFEVIVTVVGWAALVLGIVVSAIEVESTERVLAAASAAAVAGGYMVVLQAVPIDRKRLPRIGELLAVVGVGAAMTAVALTGGLESGYLLFSITPTLFASSLLGTRTGLTTALLSIAVLTAVARGLDQEIDGALFFAAGLQVLVAIGFSQARRLYLAEEARSAALGRATAVTEARLARLGAAHELLERLSGLADDAELNPVTTGRAALDQLAEAVEFDAALVAITGADGPVVVARRGEEGDDRASDTYPLLVASASGESNDVGFVVLARGLPYDEAERAAIGAVLEPVALAFSNVLLLRDIARRAVREERMRLARELHDEFGPSLASLGLALDLALLQYPTEPELGTHLQTLRGSVEGLVEEVRRTVTDLREEGRDSLVQLAAVIAADFPPDGPVLELALDERRPPRPSLAGDLGAILTEAVRNARHHSGARVIRISGFIDHDRGDFEIADDGHGFDTHEVDGSRFGIVGMKERAERMGADLEVASAPDAGTSVRIRWSP